jgi:hypothetical protein
VLVLDHDILAGNPLFGEDAEDIRVADDHVGRGFAERDLNEVLVNLGLVAEFNFRFGQRGAVGEKGASEK